MLINLNNGIADISYEISGVKYTKSLTLETFVNLFASHVKADAPLLPIGCRKYQESDGKVVIAFEIPPQHKDISYKNSSGKPIIYGQMPIPWTLFIVNAINEGTKWKHNKSSIYAMTTPLSGNDHMLYHYPFPNVHGSGQICWGNVMNSSEHGKFNTLEDMFKMYDLFFAAHFNTDIHPKINGFSRCEDMYRQIKGKPEFNTDYLHSMHSFSSAWQNNR